ncbi:MAG: phage tail protein [Chloroflexaceae bacterium]|jgi:phage tail-like protein|nr:phage tail protein [Chloroflexaceae bacterium]
MSQDIHPLSRFYVVIDGVAQAAFTELSGLQVETDVLEYAEGGNNGFVHRLPGRTRVGNITLKRGITASNELFKWYMNIAAGKKIDRRNLSIIMYDVAGKELLRWNFLRAYPVKWVGPQFDAGSNVNAVETLELAHAGLQMG